MSLPLFPSPWMNDEHRMLQDSVQRFFAERWVPQAATWREAGIMPRETWTEAGAQGLLCLSTPAAYGGGGGDFGHDAVVILEAARANLSGYGGGLHSAIVAPYLFRCGTEEQKQRLLPRMVSGELVSAIAMTEPGTGSDLQGVAAMERALDETLAYVKQRKAFGKAIWEFQNTRFKLAEVQATVLATRAFVDTCMVAHLAGELDAARAALAKSWVSEQQGRVMDECLQLFGGYGYMMEYPIAELYVDARVQRIYGGTNEIMKELASRSM